MDIQRLNALFRLDPLTEPRTEAAAKPTDGPDFGQVLKQALDKVEDDQKAAGEAAARLASGQVTDVAEVMIASERASLSLSLTIQVRNKMLEAYQEIMRMPL